MMVWRKQRHLTITTYRLLGQQEQVGFVIFACCFLVLLISATEVVALGDDVLDHVLSSKVSQLNICGASVAIFDRNSMDAPITRGYGKVSSSDQSQRVTPDTTFMIASVSKPFAASAVAAMVDQGILSSIDEDICKSWYGNDDPDKYSDSTLCRNPNFPDIPVTWRSILTHRSSMKRDLPWATNLDGDDVCPAYGPTGGYVKDCPAVGNPTCPLTNTQNFYTALFTQADPTISAIGAGVILENNMTLDWYDLQQSQEGLWEDYAPGSNHEYSNVAYGLIPALIEQRLLLANKGEESFAAFCRESLFDPLDMVHTAWFRRDLPPDTIEAVPVSYNRKNGFQDVGHYCFIDYASGQLRTTANDLAKWAGAMLNYGSPTLWSQATGESIVSCQEYDSRNVPLEKQDCQFGYGWILLDNGLKEDGGRKLMHQYEQRKRQRRRRYRSRLQEDAEDDDNDDNDDASTSSPTLSSSYESAEAIEAPWWLSEAFRDYDWTDGIWHDGSESGSQTNVVILPRAGVFVAVLTNTDGNSDDAAQELTAAAIEAWNDQQSKYNDESSSNGLELYHLSKLWCGTLLLSVLGSFMEVII